MECWREVVSQEWKSDDVMEVRTGRFVSEQPAGMFTQHTDRFIVHDDEMDYATQDSKNTFF